MEAGIIPSFIQAFIKYEKQLEDRTKKQFSEEELERLETAIFIRFKKEPWMEEWTKSVEAAYSEFKTKYPYYVVDKKTFRRAFAYHPQGRAILNSLIPTICELTRAYDDKVLKEITNIEQQGFILT